MITIVFHAFFIFILFPILEKVTFFGRKNMAQPSEVSIAVAQKVVKDYFQTLMAEDRDKVLVFYAHDSVLYWDGREYQGHEEIRQFLQDLPLSASFQIGGFDVQTVPQTDILTMLVVWGTYCSPSSKISVFHSVFCIDANMEESKAVIKYQNVSIN